MSILDFFQAFERHGCTVHINMKQRESVNQQIRSVYLFNTEKSMLGNQNFK